MLIDKMERKARRDLRGRGRRSARSSAFAENTTVLRLGSVLLVAFTNGAAGVLHLHPRSSIRWW
ncbi:hypothetical protein HBB16_03720 [Pseudonocardia sp. MCCB 268]|nr:hypothetical protein [Pseudonocardia cytotoxica]